MRTERRKVDEKRKIGLTEQLQPDVCAHRPRTSSPRFRSDRHATFLQSGRRTFLQSGRRTFLRSDRRTFLQSDRRTCPCCWCADASVPRCRPSPGRRPRLPRHRCRCRRQSTFPSSSWCQRSLRTICHRWFLPSSCAHRQCHLRTCQPRPRWWSGPARRAAVPTKKANQSIDSLMSSQSIGHSEWSFCKKPCEIKRSIETSREDFTLQGNNPSINQSTRTSVTTL